LESTLPKEIERKFLVKDGWRDLAEDGIAIKQGYLSLNPECTIRIRIENGTKAYMTVKGITTGISRSEYEFSLGDVSAAQDMLAELCLFVITKNRYSISAAGHVWSVDEFQDDNRGLVIAELELGDENEDFHSPYWIGEEVSDDVRYFNSNLAQNPFNGWKDI
jgi:adenylate cyclase